MTENSPSKHKNVIDDLRDIQHCLKRESVFNEFYEEKLIELKKDVSEYPIEHVYYQKNYFNIFSYSKSIYNNDKYLHPKKFKAVKEEVGQFNSAFISAPLNHPLLKSIEGFVNNIDDFAELLSKIDPIDERLEVLTFSTIPAFFNYLVYDSCCDKFLDLINELMKRSKNIAIQLARVLFILPRFVDFFRCVMSDIKHLTANMADSTRLHAFANLFVKKWVSCINLCPNVIKRYLSLSSDPANLLIDTFFTYLLDFPFLYGFFHFCASLNSEVKGSLLAILKEKKDKLTNCLMSEEKLAQIPTSKNISKLVTRIDSYYLFTKDDMSIISFLISLAKKNDLLNGVNPIDVSFETKYLLLDGNKFSKTSNKEELHPEKVDHENILEEKLRKIIIEIDVIPITTQYSPSSTIIDLLTTQINLARPNHRLYLEMLMNDIMQSKNNSEYTFKGYIDLIVTKFEQRDNERKEKLKTLSMYSNECEQSKRNNNEIREAILNLVEVIRFKQLFSYFSSIKNEMDNIDNYILKFEEFKVYSDKMKRKFLKWFEETHGKDVGEFSNCTEKILNYVLTKEIPLNRFKEKTKNAIAPQNDEYLNSASQSPETKIENMEKTLKFAIELHRQIPEYIYPGDIVDAIERCVNEVCANVKSVNPNSGADDVWPVYDNLLFTHKLDDYAYIAVYINNFYPSENYSMCMFSIPWKSLKMSNRR